MLIAHRGNNNHKYLENTKEAIKECLNKDYIDGIEIDIRMTKDKKLVLIHNMLIDLISNGSGFIKDKTLKQLKTYTFGKKQKISTLEEVLKIMNNKLLLIEIKEESNNFKELVNIFYKLLNKYSYLNIIVCSFNYELLKYIKSLNKNIKCALIINLIINNDKIYNHLDHNSLSLLELKKAKDNDFIWTINNKSDYDKVIRYNNTLNIISDVCYKLKNNDEIK